jgi:hypothetical protein
MNIWTWWTHRKYGIKMQITQNYRGIVNLWDKRMLFKWKGTEKQFKKEFKSA